MNKLDGLIKSLCPEGVPFRRIDEICKISRGKVISKDYINNHKGDYPVYSSQTENDGELGKIDTYDYEGEYLTWTTDGANAGSVFYRNGKFSVTNVCGLLEVIDDSVVPKYLFYVLQIEAVKYVSSGMGNPKLMSNVMARIKVQMPPVEVQCEIVRILNNFTELTSELTSELTARRKQYECYLEILLERAKKYGSGKRMSDLFEFKNGLSKGKDYFGRGNAFIRYTDVYNNRTFHKNDVKEYVECSEGELSKLSVHRGDVLFTRTSETAEEVGYSMVVLDEIENCVFNGFTIKATPKTDLLLPEFCAFCFSTNDFRKHVSTKCAFTTRASLTGKVIGEYILNVPTIDIQREIVDTLSRLYTLCNSMEEGLPAEINARKKQFEYYRRKLLEFKEVS